MSPTDAASPATNQHSAYPHPQRGNLPFTGVRASILALLLRNLGGDKNHVLPENGHTGNQGFI